MWFAAQYVLVGNCFATDALLRWDLMMAAARFSVLNSGPALSQYGDLFPRLTGFGRRSLAHLAIAWTHLLPFVTCHEVYRVPLPSLANQQDSRGYAR